MSDLDHRLRAALTDLGRTAEGRIRPAGSAGVPAAGRRRRTVRAATGVLVLALAAGSAATATRLTSAGTSTGATPAASASCAPMSVTVFLDVDGPPERRAELEAIMAGPEVAAVRFEGRTAGILSWVFTLRCADDLPAMMERLNAVPVVGYTWSDPSAPPTSPHPSDPHPSDPRPTGTPLTPVSSR